MLEEYYNLKIKTDIPFSELTDIQKLKIQNSFGFANFKLGKALEQFKEACLKFLESSKSKNI